MTALACKPLGCCSACSPRRTLSGLGAAAGCPTQAELAQERKRRAAAETQAAKRAGQVAAMQAEIAALNRQIRAARSGPTTAAAPSSPMPAASPTAAAPAPAPTDPNCPTAQQLAQERTRRTAADAQALKRAQEVGAMQAEIADLERQIREWTQRNNAKYRERNQALTQANTDLRTSQEHAETRILEAAINSDRDAQERDRNAARDAQPASAAPIVITSGRAGGEESAQASGGQGKVLLLGAAALAAIMFAGGGRKGRRR